MATTKKQKRTALPTSKAKTAYGLLSDVRRLILAEPKRYNQHVWRTRRGDDYADFDTPQGFPACGTVACIAGWVHILKPRRGLRIEQSAPKTLGLSAVQTYELFMAEAAGTRDTIQTVDHAKAGAQHIAAFQAKYKRQLQAKAV